MDIFVLNQLLERVGIVDVYTFFSWTTVYNDVGSFELHCGMEYFDLLQTDRIIQNPQDNKHSGLVEFINTVIDDEGIESLVIKGRMTEVLLERRVALGSYAFESIQPAEMAQKLVNDNAVSCSEAGRKVPNLVLGSRAEADEGVDSYAGANELLLEEIKKICQKAMIGFNLRMDEEEKKFIFDTYKGVNRTEEKNTKTFIETHKAVDILTNGQFDSDLKGWQQIDGGTNYLGMDILSCEKGKFKKTKLKDRYKKYTDDERTKFKWVYFFRKAGYLYQEVSLNNQHVYFLDILCDNPTDSVLGYGFSDAEGGYTISVGKTNGMQRFNALYVPKMSDQYQFCLAQGELPEEENIAVYTEYAAMIDLTATFGAGKEPGLNWCKENIYYDNGWNYKVQIIEFIENNVQPMVLSRDRDNLLEVQYTKSITNVCNYIYVKGDGKDITISIGNETGTMRKERFLDLSGQIPGKVDDVTLPETSYIPMLESAAKAALRKMVANEVVDCELYLLSNRQFGKDFYLGDIVNCADENIGFSVNLRISSATESWDVNGYKLSVKLGEDIPDIYETIKLVTKGAK